MLLLDTRSFMAGVLGRVDLNSAGPSLDSPDLDDWRTYTQMNCAYYCTNTTIISYYYTSLFNNNDSACCFCCTVIYFSSQKEMQRIQTK